MKQFLLVALFALSPLVSQAQLSTKVTVANNYISRGMSLYNGGAFASSSGQPIVAGSLDYKMLDKELTWSLSTTPTDSFNKNTFAIEKDTEIDYTVNYSKQVTDYVNVGAWIQHNSFMNNEDNAMNVYALNAMVLFVRLDYVYSPNYIGLKTAMTYTAASFFAKLSDKVVLQATFGRNDWEDPNKILMSDFSDQKLAVRMQLDEQTSAEMAYTNTSGRVNLFSGTEYNKDRALTFSWSKEFPL